MFHNKDCNMQFWKIPLLPALSRLLIGLPQTFLEMYHHYFQTADFFLLLLWKNDESCVSSLAEHVCRLKITDNRHMVGKSVIPLRICQDLGQGSGFPLLKLVKSEIPPGVLGRACSAHARQVMRPSYLRCLIQEQTMSTLNCTQLWCAFLFALFFCISQSFF